MTKCHFILRHCEHQVRIQNYLDDSVLYEATADDDMFKVLSADVLDSEVAYIYANEDFLCIKIFPKWIPVEPELPFSGEVEQCQ